MWLKKTEALRHGNFFPYVAACIFVAVGSALSELLRPWIEQTVMVFFVAAVVVSSWAAGMRGGITAAVLSIVASQFLISKHQPWFRAGNLIELALFLLIALLIGGLFRRLREEKELLRVTLMSIGDAVIVSDASGRVQSLNPTAEKLTGWSNDDARGQLLGKVFVIINEDTRQPSQDPVARALREGIVTGLANHTVLISRQGTEIPIEDSAAPIRRDASEIFGAVMVFRDVSGQRKVERELEESERKFRGIFEGASEGIWMLDADGRVTLVNDRMADLLGYSRDEMAGRFKWDFVFPEDVEAVKDLFAKRRLGLAVAVAVDVRFRHRDGREIHTLMSARPIFGQEKKFEGALDMFTDFTERKKMRQELERAHSELADYTTNLEAVVTERTAHLHTTIAELESISYSLAHDLRAPLRTISCFSEIVLGQAKPRLKSDEMQLLEKVISAATRLDQLIQDVLNYDHISRDRIRFRTVNVESLLRQLIAERPEFQPPQALIEIQSPLEPVVGHEAFLTQCITNLLDNAAKFVAPGTQPRVRVRSETRGDQVRLWFEDNGVGIAKEFQERIFGIFQRVHVDEGYPGTGIGLAIVRKAVERMGGSVSVESEPGKGSRFWLQLPRGSTDYGNTSSHSSR